MDNTLHCFILFHYLLDKKLCQNFAKMQRYCAPLAYRTPLAVIAWRNTFSVSHGLSHTDFDTTVSRPWFFSVSDISCCFVWHCQLVFGIRAISYEDFDYSQTSLLRACLSSGLFPRRLVACSHKLCRPVEPLAYTHQQLIRLTSTGMGYFLPSELP